MLSGQEEQAFAQIAEQIAADDPGFAASMGRLESRRAGRGHHIVAVAAAATAVLCLAVVAGTPRLRGGGAGIRRIPLPAEPAIPAEPAEPSSRSPPAPQTPLSRASTGQRSSVRRA